MGSVFGSLPHLTLLALVFTCCELAFVSVVRTGLACMDHLTALKINFNRWEQLATVEPLGTALEGLVNLTNLKLIDCDCAELVSVKVGTELSGLECLTALCLNFRCCTLVHDGDSMGSGMATLVQLTTPHSRFKDTEVSSVEEVV